MPRSRRRFAIFLQNCFGSLPNFLLRRPIVFRFESSTNEEAIECLHCRSDSMHFELWSMIMIKGFKQIFYIGAFTVENGFQNSRFEFFADSGTIF